MAEKTNSSLSTTHKSLLLSQFDRRLSTGASKQSNEALNPSSTMAKTAQFFTSLDPRSLILSQFGNEQQPNFLELTTENFELERGPRYRAYAQLRESRLRMKMYRQYPEESDPNLSPPAKKQVKFQGNLNFPASTSSTPARRKGSSVFQSVPDFSSMIRKENRRPPANYLPPVTEKSLTPPPASCRNSRLYGGSGVKSGGSKSVNAAEKRVGGGAAARKSYANMEELKGISAAAARAINGENRGGRTRTILGYRQ